MKKWGIILGVCLSIYTSRITLAQDNINVYECINKEDVDCISEYLMSGFDIDDRDGSGSSMLLIATGLGKEKVVEYLIKQGASVDMADYEGISPLHKAALTGKTAVIDLLLNAGAFVNNLDLEGRTPLMFAVSANNRFTVEQLLKRGALIEMRNIKGENARQIAVRLRHYEIVKFFDNEAQKIKPQKQHKYSWEE